MVGPWLLWINSNSIPSFLSLDEGPDRGLELLALFLRDQGSNPSGTAYALAARSWPPSLISQLHLSHLPISRLNG
jgi:hypothetical protein